MQTNKQSSSKLFFIVKFFETMYGGKNIKSKSFDFIYVHVIWNTLGHSTLDVYHICNVIYIGYQIRKITYKWPIFCEFWPKKKYCFHVCNVMRWCWLTKQKESILGLVRMGGTGNTILSKNFYHLFHNQYDNLAFGRTISMMSLNNSYMICVAKGYARMKMWINKTLTKLSNVWYWRKCWWWWIMLVRCKTLHLCQLSLRRLLGIQLFKAKYSWIVKIGKVWNHM